MKIRRASAFAWMALCCFSGACSSNESVYDFEQTQDAIVNGVPVTGTDYFSTVTLLYEAQQGGYTFLCTGALISPNYVLTAGHCVGNCGDENMEYQRNHLYVGFGQSVVGTQKLVAVKREDIHWHPNFACIDGHARNDIALLKLSSPVSSDFAKPIPLLPESLVPSSNEVSYLPGVVATLVGFGLTNPYNQGSAGVKYKTQSVMGAICTLDPSKETELCSMFRQAFGRNDVEGFIYFSDENTFICSGDSGGPVFITRNNTEYQIGINSWGVLDEDGHCLGLTSAVTYINDYRDFINQYVTDLPEAVVPEICNNGRDDNGDNLVDCQDPQCSGTAYCRPEDCNNGIDDNMNNLVDCKDPQCASYIRCLPEDCTNGIDDNGDNLIDCNDPQCRNAVACRIEDCTNGEDDNDNGMIDCEDLQCADYSDCIPENCSNGIDDNHNGLIDCNDPQCLSNPVCLPEDCANARDDNGDKLIDCEDPKCASDEHCKAQTVEDCTNGEDDDDNGLVDCKDPYCSEHSACQQASDDGDKDDKKSHEETDDDDEDCDDEDCDGNDSDVNLNGSASSCSSIPMKKSSPFSALFMLFGLCGLRRIRRRA